MNSSKYLLATVFSLIFSISIAQDSETLSLNSGTIENQFEFVFRKSGNFKGTNGQPYEAVKSAWLLALRNHVRDSLNEIRKDLNETQAIVKQQANEITQLKNKLNKQH